MTLATAAAIIFCSCGECVVFYAIVTNPLRIVIEQFKRIEQTIADPTEVYRFASCLIDQIVLVHASSLSDELNDLVLWYATSAIAA